MKDLTETKDELDRVKETSLRTEEDRDMWRRLFKDCNKKQGEEIRIEGSTGTTGINDSSRKKNTRKGIPRGQSPMELLTPRELSQPTEERIPTAAGRVTIPDPSDTPGNPVVEQTV